MNKKEAKSIGRKKAYESVTIGVIIFYIIGVFIFSNEGLRSLLWLTYLDLYNWVFIANWIITFYILAIPVGNYAGKEILIRKRNATIIGLKSGILILCFGALFGCLLGFITEGIENLGTDDNPFVDYFMKPIFWIVISGIAPACIVGIFFGRRIKNAGE